MNDSTPNITLKPAALRTPQAAEYLGLSEALLIKLRHRSEGPSYRRLGKRVIVYPVSALDTWLAAFPGPGKAGA